MKGFLQRVVRRASGHDEGVRPRVPMLFEPAANFRVDASADSPADTHFARSAVAPEPTPADDTAHPSSPPPARAPYSPPLERRPEPRSFAPQPNTRSVFGASIDGAQQGLPQETAPARGATLSPPIAVPTFTAHEVRPNEGVEPATYRSLAAQEFAPTQLTDGLSRLAGAQSGLQAGDAAEQTPRASFSLRTAVPQLQRERDAASAPIGADAPQSARAESATAPEHVVHVTIERLDVQAVSAAKSSTARPVAPRRDTLAEYVRRRQETRR